MGLNDILNMDLRDIIDWFRKRKPLDRAEEVERIVSKLLDPPYRELDEVSLMVLDAISDGPEYWEITSHHLEHVDGIKLWMSNDLFGFDVDKPFKHAFDPQDKPVFWLLATRLSVKITERDSSKTAVSRAIIKDLAYFCDLELDVKNAVAFNDDFKIRFDSDSGKIIVHRRYEVVEEISIADPHYKSQIKSKLEE